MFLFLSGYYQVPKYTTIKLTPAMTSLQLTAGTSKKFEHGAYLPPKVIPQPLFPASPAVPAIIRDMSKQENDTKFKPAHDSKIIQQGWDALKSANFTYIFSEEMLSFAKEVVKMTYNHIAQIENIELKFISIILCIGVVFLYRILKKTSSDSIYPFGSFRMSNSSSRFSSGSQVGTMEVTALPVELENGDIQIGHICFDPNVILGKGCEGTFVYK